MIDGPQWQLRQTGEAEGLDPVPLSAGGLAPHMPATAELSLLGTGNHTCPPPREEVLSRPLLEAGRLRETCRQDTNKHLLGGCFGHALAVWLTPGMPNLVETMKNPVPLCPPAL